MRSGRIALCCVAALLSLSSLASAEMIFGVVKDQTGAMLRASLWNFEAREQVRRLP
jgi:hypothetical protein